MCFHVFHTKCHISYVLILALLYREVALERNHHPKLRNRICLSRAKSEPMSPMYHIVISAEAILLPFLNKQKLPISLHLRGSFSLMFGINRYEVKCSNNLFINNFNIFWRIHFCICRVS